MKTKGVDTHDERATIISYIRINAREFMRASNTLDNQRKEKYRSIAHVLDDIAEAIQDGLHWYYPAKS